MSVMIAREIPRKERIVSVSVDNLSSLNTSIAMTVRNYKFTGGKFGTIVRFNENKTRNRACNNTSPKRNDSYGLSHAI